MKLWRILTAVLLCAAAGCSGGSGQHATSSTTASSAAGSASGSGHAVRLLETGSTLLYPLLNIWVPAYQKSHPDVQITTQGTGSGTGISQAVSGVAQIGASDAYMSNAQMSSSPILNIPLAISAQQINYNLPGLNAVHLHLSGPILAGIYSGRITKWNDPAIKAINGAVASKLPDRTIVPIHRADGSGDTFIFTQYLSFSDASWKNGPGYGTTVSWPSVANGVGATGNPGMVQTCSSTPYSIAYVGVSFLNQTNKARLGYAALANKSGAFVLPTPRTIAAAAAAQSAATPADERVSLVYAPGSSSYPIVNYEYAIVRAQQSDARTAAALVSFFTWAISPNGGNSKRFLRQVHFVALPASIRTADKRQIAKIRS